MVATELMGVMAVYSDRSAESRASVWSLCLRKSILEAENRTITVALLDAGGVDASGENLKGKNGDECVRREVADLPYL